MTGDRLGMRYQRQRISRREVLIGAGTAMTGAASLALVGCGGDDDGGPPRPVSERLIATPHGKVAIVDYGGDGPDLLLLHGAGGTLAHWGLVLPHLKGRRVVAADFRWHGLSSDEGDVGLEAFADDVEAIVEGMSLKNPAVAGHSLGGMVAAVYGSRHPECPGVANLDGHGMGTRDQYIGVSDSVYETFQRYRQQSLIADLQFPRLGDDAWRDARVGELRAGLSFRSVPSAVIDGIVARTVVKGADGAWHLRPAKEYFALAEPVFGSLRLFDVYRASECPLLIYNCTKPEAIPLEGGVEVLMAFRRGLERDLRALAAEKPNVRIKSIDAGHVMIWEIPEQVAEDILTLQT